MVSVLWVGTKQKPGQCCYYCNSLAQTHHNSVHRIQINEIIGMFACMHNDIHYKPAPDLMSSFANAVLT